MALIGLVRVSTAKQETQRQHDALDPICERVFEELSLIHISDPRDS